MNHLKRTALSIFSKTTLKRRLLVTYLLLSILILLTTSVAFYNASKTILIERAALSSQQQLALITNTLGEKIDHISDYAITLSINSNIADTLKNNPAVPDTELNRFFVNSDLTNQAQRIIGLHRNIYAWDILDTENHWFHSSTTDTDQLDAYLSKELLEGLRTNLSFQFLGPFLVNEEPTFVALKSITNIDNTKYLGALVLLIKETTISSAFRNLPESDLKNFYIIDAADNQILSSSSSEGIYQSFAEYIGVSPEELAALEQKNSQIISINGTDTLLTRKKYDPLGWYVINIIPLKELTMEHITILNNIILICILLFLLSIVFSILCTKTVTAPIQRLAAKMETASLGNLDISASYHSHDELAVLYHQFNLMMQRIQNLLHNICEEQSAKQQMEIRMLQSQINPHFLYNTLNTIKSLIELEMTDTAVKAISAMSAFYRNSLSKGQFIIPLRQELLLTEQYLYIQNLRFMEFVDYEFVYDTSYVDDKTDIPKLTIQPVVENIFVHALGAKKCHIRVEIRSGQGTIFVTITDNGQGIPPDRLAKLRESIQENTENKSSFGLPSINHRIELLYGKPYGLSISSKPGAGTTVLITLPQGGCEIEDTGNH